MSDKKEELKLFMQSDFWQNVRKDAIDRASKSEEWKKFDDSEKFFVPGAKESSRALYVEHSLNDLMCAFDLPVDYITANYDLSEGEELNWLKELERKIKADPKRYQAWKNCE